MSKEAQPACPSKGGTFEAYLPQWKTHEGWRDIQLKRTLAGVPAPQGTGGVSTTVGLCGYHQAMSLAHGFAAESEALGVHLEVRVKKFKVIYDIKAYAIQPDPSP